MEHLVLLGDASQDSSLSDFISRKYVDDLSRRMPGILAADTMG